MSQIDTAPATVLLYGFRPHPLRIPLDQLDDKTVEPGQLLCIALDDPPEAMLDELAARLGLHGRGLSELKRTHRRPRVLETAQYTLIVAMTVSLEGMRPRFSELHLLIGQDFLVIIRRRGIAFYEDVSELLDESLEFLERGSDFIASAIVDRIIDSYTDTLEAFEDGVEHLERGFLLRPLSTPDVRELYRHRRDLLRLHGTMAPLAEICRRLSQIDMAHIDPECRPYYGAAADRLMRLESLVDGLRQALAFAFEAGLMIGQAQQTDITKKLAAWAAILAIPTAVAGIYGMNFKHMPELDWTYGYGLIMALTALACVVLFVRFRKLGWL